MIANPLVCMEADIDLWVFILKWLPVEGVITVAFCQIKMSARLDPIKFVGITRPATTPMAVSTAPV